MAKTVIHEETTSTGTDEERIGGNLVVFAAILRENWENVRHIKSERMWFMNTHVFAVAGVLSFVQSIPGEFVLQLSLLLCMCFLSAVGLLTSLRLKAELEECLDRLQAMVVRAQVGEFMALGRLEGHRTHYPAFRWAFPIVYSSTTSLFFALFVYRLAFGRHP